MLLVHGFGEDGSVWDQQVEVLEKFCCCIVPDLPGSGQSEITADMSMEGMAETLKKMLDSTVAGKDIPLREKDQLRLTVIGHSMGGYITLAFAEKFPATLNAFSLFHSTAYADSEEKKSTREKGIAFIREHGGFEFLKTATPNLFSANTKDERPKLIDEFMAGLRNFSGEALVLYYLSMIARPDRTEVLRKSTVPVLFIIGENDAAIPMKDMLEQCQMPEKTYIHVLHKSGHMGMLEETEKTNQILTAFMQAT